MARLTGTIIDTMIDEEKLPVEPRILDLGSGPEMLRRHLADKTAGSVVSLDINRHHCADDDQGAAISDARSVRLRRQTGSNRARPDSDG